MNWFLSLLIGLLTAIVGGGCGLFIASKCVRWYRISSFEGGSGYYVVFIGLLGIIVGMILGTIASRFAVSGGTMHFLRGLGYAVGGMLALSVVIFGLCRLAADIAPTIDGKDLELAVEVRCPAGFTLPTQADEYGMFADVLLIRGRSQPQTKLDLAQAREVDGRWVITTTVALATNASDKRLRLYLNRENNITFWLPLRSRPRTADFEWSRWIDSGWDANKPEPPPEGKFNMRYRVQFEPTPPPSTEPTFEESQARQAAEAEAAFLALSPGSALYDLLAYTEYGTPKERMDVAIAHIQNRPNYVEELTQLIHSTNTPLATRTLRMLEHMPQPPAALNEPVAGYGRTLALLIREMNDTPPEQDPGYTVAAEISVRFSAWRVAIEALRKNAGGDFTPELQEILTLARVRTDSHCMRMDVVRVASYYLHEWAGVEPLATDPKPRG